MGRWGSNLLNWVSSPAKLLKLWTAPAAPQQKGLHSVGEAKLLKWEGGGEQKLLKCASRRFPAKGLDSPQKGLHFVGGAKLLKLAPPRGGAWGGAKLLKFGLPHKSSTPQWGVHTLDSAPAEGLSPAGGVPPGCELAHSREEVQYFSGGAKRGSSHSLLRPTVPA